MTSTANLTRQIVAHALANPDTATPLLEYLAFKALPHSDPTAIAKLIPDPEGTMGACLVQSLKTLDAERNTTAGVKG